MSDVAAGARPMVKSWVAWLLVVWIALVIHIDWHLGRPGGHHNRSFDLPYHWVSGILVFAHLAWLVSRRWPESLWRASVFIILVGVLVGQILEPVTEVLMMQMDWSPLTSMVRWHIFLTFMLAGLVTYVIVVRLLPTQRVPART